MEKVILAACYVREEKEELDSLLEECKALCQACFYDVCVIVTQLVSGHPENGFRQGKREELKRCLLETEATSVIFCHTLTLSATNHLQKELGITVLDRTALILQIFSMRAKSRQAKLQVELARLQYDLPRLTVAIDEESHMRGGSYSNRGAGEMRSSRVRKKYQNRIRLLKKELKELEKDFQLRERRRKKSLLGRVALVGYTNAGKSSLMNALLEYCNQVGQDVYVKDMLFATLDTSVRNVNYKGNEFLLYDTVGFVSNLPHHLVEAFQSTLESTKDADLLLHVVDASDPSYQEKEEITVQTLKQIHADHIPCITVYNKIDLREETESLIGLKISCVTKEGLEQLCQTILNNLYPREEALSCHIPYSKLSLLQEGKKVLQIKENEYDEEGIWVDIAGKREHLKPFWKYQKEK